MANEQIIKSRYPHTEWLDLDGSGNLIEAIIMNREPNGTVYFIALKSLDQIDLQRIGRIVGSRNASMFPMHELMAQTTLGNGINALLYFQQLVKMRTPGGQVMAATNQIRSIGNQMANRVQPTASMFESQQVTSIDPATAMLQEAQQAQQAPRRGRPAAA